MDELDGLARSFMEIIITQKGVMFWVHNVFNKSIRPFKADDSIRIDAENYYNFLDIF